MKLICKLFGHQLIPDVISKHKVDLICERCNRLLYEVDTRQGKETYCYEPEGKRI